jgi:malate permease and related proteins
MDLLFPLFTNNILPIFIIAGCGLLLGKYTNIKPRDLSKIVFYLFSPSLVFKLITNSNIDGGLIAKIFSYTIISTFLIGIIAFLVSKALNLSRKMSAALILSVMFANAGNYGLSLNEFAFGTDALAFASIYFVVQTAIIYTVGIFIASLGESNFKESLLNLLKVPTIYALAIAGLMNLFSIELPLALSRSVGVMGNAAIPCMLVLLGLQLYKTNWSINTKALISANILRLVVAPLIAIGLTTLFSFTGDARRAMIVEFSLSTAVIVTVVATEYNINPKFVTAVVTSTTILSPLILTPLLQYLQ